MFSSVSLSLVLSPSQTHTPVHTGSSSEQPSQMTSLHPEANRTRTAENPDSQVRLKQPDRDGGGCETNAILVA